MTTALSTLDKALGEALAARADKLDVEAIRRGFEFSAAAHRGQKRASGDDFISHSLEVARILVELNLDTTTIIAALLHDVAEDAEVTIGEIREQFGDDVAGIVDGLTKISTLQFRSSTEEQVENYRKLMISIARDARTMIVKLADRLHNMRTLEHLSEESRRRNALETREIYAPLAHRFGMAGVKAELEDLAFKFLEPEDYKGLARRLQARREERDGLIERLREPLEGELTRAGIPNFEVSGRAKHLWSIWKKVRQREKTIEEIYDLMAVRVLVDTVRDCYHALGVIHHTWTPLQERFKDYIASPKSNAYQSLHTTIFGPGGRLYEIQIRTREMHRTAEFGIAAHWVYKEGRRPDELDERFAWFRQLMEMQKDARSPEEFLEFLKIDLYQDEIFVFTPKGDVKRLPRGATPIDFAFAVHSEVGLRCQGAKVNGRIAPLHRALRNGDTVEVITGTQARASRDWLSHVRTARARHRIRQWINREEAESSVQLGREILARELRRRRLDLPDESRQVEAAAQLSLAGGPDAVFESLGRGDVPIGQVIRALFPQRTTEELDVPTPSAFGRVMDRIRLGRGVKVQGMAGLVVRYAQCCQPVPGDEVTGFVTQGRGISIHRIDCPNLLTMPQETDRRVEIDWKSVEGEVFMVRLAVDGEDRRGLYADLLEAVSGTGTNIRQADLSSRDGAMFGNVVVEVEHSSHLAKVIRVMRRVKGVHRVERHEAVPREQA